MLEVRARIAALIKDADAEKLTLMLQEWYLEAIDVTSAKELLANLPSMIETDDKERYKHNPIVNDIEWSALATISRCCIAVKFLISQTESRSLPAQSRIPAGRLRSLPQRFLAPRLRLPLPLLVVHAFLWSVIRRSSCPLLWHSFRVTRRSSPRAGHSSA